MELRLAGRKALHEFESKQETLRNFNAVLSGVDNGVMLLGWDLRVQLVNPEFCRMFQISNAAAADHPTFLEIANHLRRIAIADMPDAHWNAFIQLQEDGPGQSEQLIHEWQLFDGRTLEQKCIATAAGGRLLTYRDITGRKEADRLKNEQLASTSHELQALQSELARVAKLTTVREMAGSIAHEINQPLAAIVANANAGLRWLGKSTPDLTEASAALNCIINDGHRASQAIGSIWSHLKKGATEAAPVDINALIKEVLMVLRSELESHAVSVKVDLDDGLPPVMAVHSQLQQVIINLCLNAAEAMSSMSERARLLWVRSERCGSSNVIIYVEDNGPGIDPLTMNMMFRSFFTTKHQGIGLGLSACRSIIEAHGGKLVATNGPVHGAIFEVSVPIAGERSFPLANQGWSKRCRM